MQKIHLRKTSRILKGHLWIFSNEIQTKLKGFTPGSIVDIFDNKNLFLGRGYINPHSLIAARILTRNIEEIDREFIKRRLTDAIEYRKKILSGIETCRIVFSESDLFPGLIIDKYNDSIVIQSLTAGVERMLNDIISVVDDLLNPVNIVLRNDSLSRKLEGLELKKEFIRGSVPLSTIIKEKDLFFEIDLLHGQKTGFFLDQRENRIAFSELVRGGRGLDLFCYTGAWGMHLAKKGCEVRFIDESKSAIEFCKRNSEINGVSKMCEFIVEDVFNYLTDNKEKYDFIILDPPAFVKSKSKIREAIKGYRALNAMAMRALKKGGLFSTSSCSYHISRETFLEVLRDSAKDSNRYLRIIELRTQARDHPILLQVPETEYLKCFFLEVL